MHSERLQRRTVTGYCAQASDQGNGETPITNYFCQTAVSDVRPFQLFATGAATVLEGTGEISQQVEIMTVILQTRNFQLLQGMSRHRQYRIPAIVPKPTRIGLLRFRGQTATSRVRVLA